MAVRGRLYLTEEASATLEKLIKNMKPEAAKKLDAKRGYMPLHVEYLYDDQHGHKHVSLAHYGEMNGDLMADPDMQFYHNGDGWIPVNFTNHYAGVYQESVSWHEDGTINGIYPHVLKELREFAAMWLNNIKEQQL